MPDLSTLALASGAALDAAWTTVDDANALGSVAGGALTVTVPDPAGPYYEIDTDPIYTLLGSTLTWEVPDGGPDGNLSPAAWQLRVSSPDYARSWFVEVFTDGLLHARTLDAATYVSGWSATWDGTAHRFVAIAFDADATRFYTSPTGLAGTWVLRYASPVVAATLGTVQLLVYANDDGGSAVAPSFTFGGANTAVSAPTAPSATATVRETTLSVTATPFGGTSPDDDVAIDQALAARCTFGFDQPVSEALVPVPEMPVGVAYGDTLTIKFGVVGSGNETAVRFKGTLEERRYDLYPRTVTLVGKGPLWKAQQYQNWEDPGDNGGLTVDDLMGYRVFSANAGTDVITATGHTYSDGDVVIVKIGASGAVLPAPLATYVKYFVRDSATNTFKLAATLGGSAINLTTAGSGTLWVETAPTDENLVMAVLDRCGVAYDPALIGGTGQLWGAQNDDELLWKTGEAAAGANLFAGPGQGGLDWILALDAVSAMVFDAGASGGFYRTFDGPAGKVRRLLIGGRPRNAVDFTFEEGVNIWQGSAVRSVLEQKNGVVVHGWDDGKGGASEAVAPSGLVPSTSTRVYTFSHALIEFDDAADRTAQGYEDYVGMDCETVGLAILLEVDRETVAVQLATPEDWLLCPGQTHLVQGPGGAADRLGTGEVLWCKSLTAECDERGAITQHPGEIGGGIDVPADGDPNLDEVPFA